VIPGFEDAGYPPPQRLRIAKVAGLNPIPFPMTTPPLPEQIELHRDRMWRRGGATKTSALKELLTPNVFIEDVGLDLRACIIEERVTLFPLPLGEGQGGGLAANSN
jgi:hypothetical protein